MWCMVSRSTCSSAASADQQGAQQRAVAQVEGSAVTRVSSRSQRLGLALGRRSPDRSSGGTGTVTGRVDDLHARARPRASKRGAQRLVPGDQRGQRAASAPTSSAPVSRSALPR